MTTINVVQEIRGFAADFAEEPLFDDEQTLLIANQAGYSDPDAPLNRLVVTPCAALADRQAASVYHADRQAASVYHADRQAASVYHADRAPERAKAMRERVGYLRQLVSDQEYSASFVRVLGQVIVVPGGSGGASAQAVADAVTAHNIDAASHEYLLGAHQRQSKRRGCNR